MVIVQGSLLDETLCVQRPNEVRSERMALEEGAFVDLHLGLLAGSQAIVEWLVSAVSWREEERFMYERVVAVPRLVSFYSDYHDLPELCLIELGEVLSEHYRDEMPEGFSSAGLCCYRDGRDSVAWHGDTIGRGRSENTLVAVLSLGATRRFLLRRRGGGASIPFDLSSGDVLVMGGSCQRTYEHSVPKRARPVATRLSIQFRAYGVR